MAAIDVRHAMLAKLQREGERSVAGGVSIPLLRPPRVVAFGKAANRMAATLHEISERAGRRRSDRQPCGTCQALRTFPLLSWVGILTPTLAVSMARKRRYELLTGLTPDDFVIFLVSGGGSALFEKPPIPVSLSPT